ncbi:hypothetical protein PG997_014056 [Apiospora hydei]|uniref:Uncharacterized protein n=1 Tax=Apiospora hydei TaxID=1337664 RepID=A0ABR1VB99_9PEZI
MLATSLLMLALAGTGLSLRPNEVDTTLITMVQTFTSIGYPSTSPFSSSPSAISTTLPVPKADDSTKAFLIGGLINERAVSKAEKCRYMDQEIFVDKTLRFLGVWKPDGGVSAGSDVLAPKQLLERLVQYQDAYRLVSMEPPRVMVQALSANFPDNIVEEIRKMKHILDDRGILRGGNERVLDALDIIFDDLCADTGKTAQIPLKVQEMVDVVLRGISG